MTLFFICILLITTISATGNAAMIQENALVLSEEMCVIWSEAGSAFTGDRLNEVLARTLVDLPKDRTFLDYYVIRRTDVPTAFDALLNCKYRYRTSVY